jgi:hypothetical protein
MEAYNKPNFDELSHIQIILVNTYCHMLSAATGTRIKQFENEAARRPRMSAALTGGIATLWRVKLPRPGRSQSALRKHIANDFTKATVFCNAPTRVNGASGFPPHKRPFVQHFHPR